MGTMVVMGFHVELWGEGVGGGKEMTKGRMQVHHMGHLLMAEQFSRDTTSKNAFKGGGGVVCVCAIYPAAHRAKAVLDPS